MWFAYVVLTLPLGHYDTETTCWLDPTSAVYYAGFLVPMSIIMTVNSIVLIRAVMSIRALIDENGIWIKATASFFVMLGLTWLFGLMVAAHDWIGWQYLFVLGLASHGVLLLGGLASNSK